MTSERWQAICSLFDEAVRCTLPDREVLLRDRCAGDKELKAAVERLLANDELVCREGFLAAHSGGNRWRGLGERSTHLSSVPGCAALRQTAR